MALHNISLDTLIELYETEKVVQLFQLSRAEFMYLYWTATGFSKPAISDLLGKQKTAIYDIQNRIIRKFKVNHMEQAMFCFGKFIDT